MLTTGNGRVDHSPFGVGVLSPVFLVMLSRQYLHKQILHLGHPKCRICLCRYCLECLRHCVNGIVYGCSDFCMKITSFDTRSIVESEYLTRNTLVNWI